MPWYRTIDVKSEITTLAIRHYIKDNDLEEQPDYRKEDADRYFTPLSSFQYLKAGIKQFIFSKIDTKPNEFKKRFNLKQKIELGVMVRRRCEKDPRRSVYWRDVPYEFLSDGVFKEIQTEEGFKRALARNKFIKIIELDVSQKKMVELFKNHKKCHESYQKELEEEAKEKGEAYKKDKDPGDLMWTEGLFRYEITDIEGVVVDKEDPTNRITGIAFSHFLEKCTGKSISLFRLSSDGSRFKKLKMGKFSKENAEEISKCRKKMSKIWRQTMKKLADQSAELLSKIIDRFLD